MDYLSYSDNITGFPHIQGLSALHKLSISKNLEPNTVFINGNSGDFITGGHIPKTAFLINHNEKINRNFEIIFNEYFNKHFSLFPYKKNKKNYAIIKDKYNELLKRYHIEKNSNLYSLFEYFELIDRQSKFTIQCQKTFEFMNYDWNGIV